MVKIRDQTMALRSKIISNFEFMADGGFGGGSRSGSNLHSMVVKIRCFVSSFIMILRRADIDHIQAVLLFCFSSQTMSKVGIGAELHRLRNEAH